MRHHATSEGILVKIEAEFVFDGGAYASTSSAVLVNAVTHAQGPYRCENADVKGIAVRTNNLPCGAMRGFGVVQACFAHERQMDLLAQACGLDPLEIRRRNAMSTGDRLITGQVVESVAPVSEIIEGLSRMPFPQRAGTTEEHPYELPGGAGNTSRPVDVVRGIGYGLSIKNLMYSEAFDDYSTGAVSYVTALSPSNSLRPRSAKGSSLSPRRLLDQPLGSKRLSLMPSTPMLALLVQLQPLVKPG